MKREYGLGRKRTDLLLVWPTTDGANQKVVFELKIVHGAIEQTIWEGPLQTAGYMDRGGADEGHLIIFDRNRERSWTEKIFHRSETYSGKAITIWEMSAQEI